MEEVADLQDEALEPLDLDLEVVELRPRDGTVFGWNSGCYFCPYDGGDCGIGACGGVTE